MEKQIQAPSVEDFQYWVNRAGALDRRIVELKKQLEMCAAIASSNVSGEQREITDAVIITAHAAINDDNLKCSFGI